MKLNKAVINYYGIIAILCIIMWLNMCYMHYEVYFSHYSFGEMPISYPMLFWLTDVLLTFSFLYLCTWGRIKLAFVLSYLILDAFVLANTIYSRFFNQYFSFNVLKETSNLQGTWWVQYIPMAFRWTDMLLIVTTLLFFYLVKKLDDRQSNLKAIAAIVILFISSADFIVMLTRDNYVSLRSYTQIKNWIMGTQSDTRFHGDFNANYENPTAEWGVLISQVYRNIIRSSNNHELNNLERHQIKTYLGRSKNSILPDSCTVKGTPNIIFILVESYMSMASLTKIDDKEIMPHINSLLKEKNTYSNFTVTSNRGIGESSDAQVSYFTGLIPLQSEISVSHIIKNEIISFPKLLCEQRKYNTYITVPTGKHFWHQDEANIKYGIDNIIETGNEKNSYFCQDDEAFKILEKKQKDLISPYLNIILTLSMHGPYNVDFLKARNLKSPFNYPKNYSKELCHYLDKCYFTDIQIGHYIDYLKRIGEYDKSVIIICSDHQTPDGEIKDKNLKKDLPLIIINSFISPEKFYHGSVNQIDLFPTMLDMFGIKSQWRGLGRSLLRKNYIHKITEEERNISNMIILGDYFRY